MIVKDTIEALIKKGWKVGGLAIKLGVAQPNISRWRKDTEPRGDTRDKIRELAIIEGVLQAPTPADKGIRVARMPKSHLTHVPLVSWISAGKMTGGEVPPNVRAEKRIPVADLPKGEWIALQVQGDSMNLIAPEGAIIFVDISDKRLTEDRFYVFRQENGDATFKRYRGGRQPRMQPYSTNPDHETLIPQDDVVVVGRVRRVVNELG